MGFNLAFKGLMVSLNRYLRNKPLGGCVIRVLYLLFTIAYTSGLITLFDSVCGSIHVILDSILRLLEIQPEIVEYREINLMSLALLFHYLMLNMFRMLIHPSSGACDLFVELFHGLCCSGSMCLGVTLWCGIRMQAEACIRIPHHPSQTTT